MSRTKLEAGVIAAMESASASPMEWGRDDCALWVANVIHGALGYDPAASFRGRYSTRRGAMRAMGKKGMLGVARASARRHKWKRVHPQMAQPGDLALVWTEYRGTPVLASAICRGSGWFVARNDLGFSAIRSDMVAACWSVLDDHRPGARTTFGNPDGLRRPMVPVVSHEPISTAIALTAFIASTFGTSVAIAGAIGGAIVSATISIGFSLAASLLQPTRGSSDAGGNIAADSGSVTQGAQITERQSIPYKRVILGSAYVGGALFFEQVKPPYLTIGVLIAYGDIAGIDSIRIGTDTLSFSGITPNTILTPLGVDEQPSYNSYLRTSVRYGADDQAVDPLILARYPSIGTEFRQRGNSTAVMEYHFGGSTQEDFLATWGQVSRPSAYFVVRGTRVYDPRDPTQSETDETTWKWSNNASLVQAHYLTVPWGGRIPSSKIRWDKVAESADYDDQVVACGDGTFIKRHTIDGVVTLNQQPYQVLPQLLTANRGMILESGGQVWVQSSKPRTAVATINDRMLTSGVKYQAAKEKRSLVNKVQVRAVAPEQDYQTVDGPILNDTALQAIDQEVLTGTLDLPYTLDTSTNWTRVQRLQKAFLASSRLGKTLTVSVDSTILAVASDELIGNVVTFESTLFPSANRDYMVTAVGFSDDFTSISLALTEYDPTIETDWDPATDERPFTYELPDIS